MKKIRIGNQTVFYSQMEPFQYAIKNCFDSFEWFPDKPFPGQGWDVGQIGTATRRYIKDTARLKDMALSVHAMLPGNPTTPEGIKGLYRDIEFAKDVGATVFNMHLYGEGPFDDYIDGIGPIIKTLGELGIGLSIENTPLTSPEDFNELFEKLKGESNVGMCLDLGHANLFAPTRNNYLAYVERLNAPISHIHMHENYGDKDSHLAVFTGPSAADTKGIEDFVEMLKGRGFSGSIILEQWPNPPEILSHARKRLSRMLGPYNV